MSVLNINKRCNYYFEEIEKIPRGTNNELAISNYIEQFAIKNNLKVIHEKCNNIIIYKNASIGYENKEPLLLQGHMDMVCEKNRGVMHDFEKDPLDLYIEDGYLKARGTTLGGDDGVAVAYMLAILEDTSLKHPPLECLFTVGEEEGLTGAFELDASNIASKRMIGLDNTHEGTTYVSSAGGVDVHIEKEMNIINNVNNTYSLSITGLLGGHSAVCIQLGRGNAIKIMSRILYHIHKETDINIVSIEGGLKFNAIPRECFVTFTSTCSFDVLNTKITALFKDIKEEYNVNDPSMKMEFKQVDTVNQCFDLENSKEFIKLLYLLKSGCIEMLQGFNMPSLSLNLGVLNTLSNTISVTYLIRSSLKSNRFELAYECEELSHLCHAKCTISGDYDGWNYDPESKIREDLKKFYKDETGKEYIEEAVHGGLEIGLFKGKIPDLDVVTFGPTVLDYHTPDEAMDIASFERCYDLLVKFLEIV